MSKRKVSNPVSVAREWLARGVMPIPIQPASKRPSTKHLPEGQSWNKVKVTEKNVEEHFRAGQNVGALWGEPSNWVVDLDLDWEESTKIAPRIMPETFVYGRTSRPGSHYLYRCKNVKTFKRFLGEGDGTGSVVIEVRSTGTQSVLPPSVHPDGDRFEINNDCDFTELSEVKLERLVNKLAVLSVFARMYPSESGRHDYVHAMTGALMWSQWGAEEVATGLSAVLECVTDREDETDQRERTVINTIEKFESGEKVNGWPALEPYLKDYKDTVHGWATVKSKKSRITLKKKSKKVEASDPESDGPPEDLEPYVVARDVNPCPSLEVPGLVGKIAKWVHRTSYADQPILDIGAAFTILALATQNRYIVQGTNTPLSPFFMALSRTGGGKDSARQAVITAADQIRLSEKTFGGFQSFHALLDELGKPPHVMCWLWDEAARKLRAAAKSSAGSDSAVITWLLDLYGKGNATVLGLPGRKQTIAKIDHPFMLVMAFAQPEDMIASITLTDISTGLLNRFILLDTGDAIAPSHYPDYNGFPSAIADALTDISRVRPAGEADFVPVGWASSRVFNRMRDFREECRGLSDSEIASGEIWGRAWQNALIIAGLLAVGVDHKKPLITEELALWACDFIRWSCNNWMIRIEASSARSMTEKNSKTIERMIREPYAFKKFVKGPAELEILGKQWMPKAVLVRACRYMKLRDLEESLNQLAESDVIGTADYRNQEIFWWKPVAADED